MSLYAMDDIDDAFEATRAFLWPFDLRRWTKLALVVFFIGGAGGANPFQFGFGGSPTDGGTGQPGGPGPTPEIGPEILAIVLAVVAAAIVVGLLFALVGSIMEFVFVESLRREEVALRRFWGRRWRQGVRLFGFRVGVGLLSIAIVAAVVALLAIPVLAGVPAFAVVGVVVAIPLLLLLVVVGGLVWGFTTVFVVPIMIAEDRGVLAAWRRFWPTMVDQWREYAVYAVMSFVLSIAAALLAGLAALVGAVVVGIPLGVVGIVGWSLLSTSAIAGWVLVGAAIALFVLAMLVIVSFANVPVQSFLRYYALFVLGDTNEEFDLIAERREAVRE